MIVITILTGNEISKVEGIEQLTDLTELVLDRNKIKVSEYLEELCLLFFFRAFKSVHFMA